MAIKWRIKYKMRKALSISVEAIADKGLQHFIDIAMRYDRGFKGVFYRTGINGDDFVMNRRAIVVFGVKAPRLLAPKARRLNKLSNRKLKRYDQSI